MSIDAEYLLQQLDDIEKRHPGTINQMRSALGIPEPTQQHLQDFLQKHQCPQCKTLWLPDGKCQTPGCPQRSNP